MRNTKESLETARVNYQSRFRHNSPDNTDAIDEAIQTLFAAIIELAPTNAEVESRARLSDAIAPFMTTQENSDGK